MEELFFLKRKDYGNSPHIAFKTHVKFTVQKLFKMPLSRSRYQESKQNRCVLFQDTLKH